MTKREAVQLAKRIQRQNRLVTIRGFRHQNGTWALDCQDCLTGYPFVVRDAQDWQRRRDDAETGVWDGEAI
jgi:hypothetical protein